MVETLLLAVVGLLAAAGLGVAIAALLTGRSSARRVEDALLRVSQTGTEVSALRQTLDTRLDSFTHTITQATYNIDHKLAAAGDTISAVNQGIGELRQTSSQVLELGRNIQQLQDILRPPKARGVVGEVLLDNILAQILPAEAYDKEHRLGNEKVDFAIRVGELYVPIDVKFPMEEYERLLGAEEAQKESYRKQLYKNVEQKIASISEKYIRPSEGTYNFALMYLPSEGVYYELFAKDSVLLDIAAKYRVFPCSPSTMYAYLITVALGLKGLKMEKQAAEVLKLLQTLNNDLAKFRKGFETLGGHLRDASHKYDDATRLLQAFGDKLTAVERAGADDDEPAPLPLA